MAMRGKCTGSAANCHIAAGDRSAVVYTLQPDEEFEILHTVGSGNDSWLAVRNRDRLNGYLRANTPMTTTGSLEPRPQAPGPETLPPDGARDMMIGAAFVVLGIVVMSSFTALGTGPSLGFGKEWLAIGYGVYRFGKGLYSYSDR